MKLLETLLQRYQLKTLATFTTGHKCQTVYKVQRGEDVFVLKVGLTDEAVGEIHKNLRGYELLREQKLDFFIPVIHEAENDRESSFILMEYCGDSFSQITRKGSMPEKVYEKLTEGLITVYSLSKTISLQSSNTPDEVHKVIMGQYQKYLQPVFDQEMKIFQKLSEVLAEIDLGECRNCFASWDFTPQNVFIPNGSVKYVDPNDRVIGIPIIDLACFAGVIHDVEDLPGKEKGYEILQKCSEDAAKVLAIPDQKAWKLFCLGRVLQSFLSARFRIASDITKASWFFNQGCLHLEKITD